MTLNTVTKNVYLYYFRFHRVKIIFFDADMSSYYRTGRTLYVYNLRREKHRITTHNIYIVRYKFMVKQPV
jgi:hypothetical protein